MKRAGKKGWSRGVTSAGIAILLLASPSLAATEPQLELPRSALTAPRFGVAAAWPRYHLEIPPRGDHLPAGASAGTSADDPRDATAGAEPAPEETGRPGKDRVGVGVGAGPPTPTPTRARSDSPPFAPSPPRPVAPSPKRPLTLQPSLVERELLARTFQRLANGDPGPTTVDRRELALRALETLQGSPDAASKHGDPLKQIGLDRRRVGSALALTEGRFAGMEFVTVRSRGGEIRRQQFQAGDREGPTLHLNWTEVGSGFNRFQDLTAEEKSWVGAMRGMQRLEFGGQKLALAGGKAALGLLQIADGGARARRMSLGFQNERWTVSALSQRADNAFERLGDLTEADRKLFGKERGIARDTLDLGYTFGGGRKLTASSLSLRAASGAAQQRQFEYLGGPNLQLRLNFGQVDPGFDRIADLFEPDKKALAPHRGMRWTDMSLKLNPARWLSTENQWFRGTHLETGLHSTQLRNLWTLQFAPRSKLTLLRHLVEVPSGSEGQRRSLTQSVRLEQWLTRSIQFTGFRETVENALSDGDDSNGRRLALRLNTATGRPLQWSADYSTAERPDGKSERALQWSLGLPLRKGLNLTAKGHRREVEEGDGLQTLALGLNGQLARDWNLALSLNSADSTKGTGTRDLGARLTFAGLPDRGDWKETRVVLGIGDTEGLPLAVPAYRKDQPAPPSGPPARRFHSLSVESKLRGQPFSLGYFAADGTAGGLTYRLTTDPKRPLHLEALREVRDLGRTSLVARERYGFQARLGHTLRLAASFEENPEQSPGKLLLGHTQRKVEAETQIGGLKVTASVASDEDLLKETTSRLTSLGVAGNLDDRNNLRFTYTSRGGDSSSALPVRLVRLEYERKPDELLLVALRAEWRDWTDERNDELMWQLDLKAVF